MKRPKVMTSSGPLHLPVRVKHPTEGWCYSFADGEYEKWEAMAEGLRALPGQPYSRVPIPGVQALIKPMPLPDTSGRVLTMDGVALMLGIPSGREARKFRWHDLRHLFAVNLVRVGTSLPDIGKLLGHRTPAMVWRYSCHSPAGSGQVAVRALDVALSVEPADRTGLLSERSARQGGLEYAGR